MAREICLSGGDVSVIKALGLSGSQMSGRNLIGRLAAMDGAEIVDTLSGLVQMDYVLCDVDKLRSVSDMEEAKFSINTAMLRDLARGADAAEERVETHPPAPGLIEAQAAATGYFVNGPTVRRLAGSSGAATASRAWRRASSLPRSS